MDQIPGENPIEILIFLNPNLSKSSVKLLLNLKRISRFLHTRLHCKQSKLFISNQKRFSSRNWTKFVQVQVEADDSSAPLNMIKEEFPSRKIMSTWSTIGISTTCCLNTLDMLCHGLFLFFSCGPDGPAGYPQKHFT